MMDDFVGMSGFSSFDRFKNSSVRSYVALARTLGVKRRTVSKLWFMMSGPASMSVWSAEKSPIISDGSTSIDVSGFMARTARTVSANTVAP